MTAIPRTTDNTFRVYPVGWVHSPGVIWLHSRCVSCPVPCTPSCEGHQRPALRSPREDPPGHEFDGPKMEASRHRTRPTTFTTLTTLATFATLTTLITFRGARNSSGSRHEIPVRPSFAKYTQESVGVLKTGKVDLSLLKHSGLSSVYVKADRGSEDALAR